MVESAPIVCHRACSMFAHDPLCLCCLSNKSALKSQQSPPVHHAWGRLPRSIEHYHRTHR